MSPQRIQRRRTKGWVKPEGAVIVDRTSRFGNPFTAASAIDAGYAETKMEARQVCTEAFRNWLGGRDFQHFAQGRRTWILRDLHLLKGRDLACTCAVDGLPCHGDVLLEIANSKVAAA